MKQEEMTLNEMIALAQHQCSLRDEFASRQEALAHEVAAADVHGMVRASRLLRVIATVVLLVAPSTLVTACTHVPDGRDMCSEVSRPQLIDEINQIIVRL